MSDVQASVRDYYGNVLKSSNDLQTSACCIAESMPAYLKPLLARVHDQVQARFYGCGSPLPPGLSGTAVLDLGCGSGRDCYLLSQLVGAGGRVIGIDMTEAQLEVARRYLDWHGERFGHRNVEFRHGYIEDLNSAGIAHASVDVVVSNCVLNLSPDKARVFAEIFRVLKPGGELYFSDVFADRRLPAEFARDPVLLGECLGGALYIEDFRRLLAQLGCLDARVVSVSPLELHNDAIQARVGNARFHSITIRAFKLAMEDRCEDYGQVACYLGTLPETPHAFVLDDHHRFVAGKPMLVCGNTADMLGASRYREHFRIEGDKSVHFGLFECAPTVVTQTSEAGAKAGCC